MIFTASTIRRPFRGRIPVSVGGGSVYDESAALAIDGTLVVGSTADFVGAAILDANSTASDANIATLENSIGTLVVDAVAAALGAMDLYPTVTASANAVLAAVDELVAAGVYEEAATLTANVSAVVSALADLQEAITNTADVTATASGVADFVSAISATAEATATASDVLDLVGAISLSGNVTIGAVAASYIFTGELEISFAVSERVSASLVARAYHVDGILATEQKFEVLTTIKQRLETSASSKVLRETTTNIFGG